MPIKAEDLVRREVHYCVSALVSTLAQSGGMGPDLSDLCGQAFELSTSVLDYEEAAREAGWYPSFKDDGTFTRPSSRCQGGVWATSWQEACAADNIEPHEWEVFEHWIVSDWLADKLIEHGEKVDKDFAGLTVWARTCTGQGIASDAVIEKITAELNGEA